MGDWRGPWRTPAICQETRGRHRLRRSAIWGASPKKPPAQQLFTLCESGLQVLKLRRFCSCSTTTVTSSDFRAALDSVIPRRPALAFALKSSSGANQLMATASRPSLKGRFSMMDWSAARNFTMRRPHDAARAALCHKRATHTPMELLRVLRAAAHSLEHHALRIRHRELAGYLPLTALGVTTGEPTYLSIHEGQTRGSLSKSCLGPTKNKTPNDKT